MMNARISMAMCLFLTVTLLSQQSIHAFVSHAGRTTTTTSAWRISGAAPSIATRKTLLFSSPEDNNDPVSDNSELLEKIAAVTETAPPTPANKADDSTSYPIDLPSPLLLASSMLLAIVGTGSGFDLANSTPRYGFGITFSIATVSLTVSVGLFYASILKAKAETEADDQEYMRGK